MKKFKELVYDDYLYYLNPFQGVREANLPLEMLLAPTLGGQGQFIQPVRIKNVQGIPDDVRLRQFVDIEYFRPESILHSPDIEKIPTVTIRLNGERFFALSMVSLENQAYKFPVPFCTDKEYLTAYVKSTR